MPETHCARNTNEETTPIGHLNRAAPGVESGSSVPNKSASDSSVLKLNCGLYCSEVSSERPLIDGMGG